jgi:hypothetical protein
MSMVEGIKQSLRDCQTPQEVHAVADKFRDNVRALYSKPDTKAQAIQISNLKAHRLRELRR